MYNLSAHTTQSAFFFSSSFFFFNSLNSLSTPAICYVLAGLVGAHFPPLLMMDELAHSFSVYETVMKLVC